MTILDSAAILALVLYAVYKQTKISEVTAAGRFKLAIIYVAVGVGVGGFDLPSGSDGVAMLIGSLLLSIVVGLARGRLTRIWVEPDGRILKQGTALTIGLFAGMVLVKFGMGVVASLNDIDDGQGFGATVVMIGLMIAVQAQIVWMRAQKLAAGSAPRIVAAAL